MAVKKKTKKIYTGVHVETKKFYFCRGELAEWSNAVVLKTIDPSRGPGVRIPHSPQLACLPTAGKPADRTKTHNSSCGFLFLL